MKFINALCHFIQYGDLPTSYYTKRGMKIGSNFNRQSDTKFDPSHCWLISFGNNVTIANGVIFLAHDDTPRVYTEYGRVGRICVGDNVFFGARSIILPGVIVEDNVIVGAGSVVTKSIPAGKIVAGSPAKIIGETDQYISRCREQITRRLNPVFDLSWSIFGNPSIGAQQKEEMFRLLEKQDGFQFLGTYKS